MIGSNRMINTKQDLI